MRTIGHKDFILCLGYKADVIKNFFLNYDQCLSSDFTLSNGDKRMHLKESDISDWSITFADTGLKSNIGQRLKAVEKYLVNEEMFLANYADGVTDLPLPTMIDYFTKSGKIGCFICVKPSQSFHVVTLERRGCREKHPVRKGHRHHHQRGMLYFPEGNFPVHQGRRGAGRRAVPAIDQGEPAARVSIR